MERYVQRLCFEIRGARQRAESLGADLPTHVDSLYFGGGTPSLLLPPQIERIFDALSTLFTLNSDAEITLEAAPGQITDETLDCAIGLGVNRVSLGVQSFIDRECTSVGRLHTGKDCIREIVRLRAAGLPEVCADLIAGLPYQTAESFGESLEIAAGVGLTHLSVYMLEVDEDSRLGREVIAGGQRFHAPGVPADELSAEMYEQACEFLPRNGFAQYEISNFAGAGHQSRHNRKYWERAPYLGFGLDAHSMLQSGSGAVRFANADELARYGELQAPVRVGEREAFEEKVFLGLRLNEGLRLEGWRGEWTEAFAESARDLVAEGLMGHADGVWTLTRRGRMVSNEVFQEFLTA